MASFIRIIIILVVVLGLAGAIYVLWQRQPEQITKQESTVMQTVATPQETPIAQTFITSPAPEEILPSTDVKITGNSKAGYVVMYSQSANQVISANDNFESSIKLQNGLNLVQVINTDSSYKELQNVTLPMYVSKPDADKKLFYKAGLIKKIFEDTITIGTSNGDTDITINSSTLTTNTASPTPTKSPSPKKDNDLRVADYIVAIGEKDKEILRAQKIEIYRDNKPTIGKTYAVAKISSPAKSNIFSAVSQKDNNLIELTLDKNSQIYDKDKKVDTRAIAKDKLAIIIYSQSQNNLVSFVYLI